MDKGEIQDLFNDIEYDNLTDDQHTFVASLEEQFDNLEPLSSRQIEILKDIHFKSRR